jgi:uncharacterized BrkB/YihY/UPF0761 family membrane protein
MTLATPEEAIPWRDVWTGSVVTALLFTIGKVMIGRYLGRSGLSSGFGAAGSLVMLAAWVYYSAQIFLFGAEYTWVYANCRGSRSRQGATQVNSRGHPAASRDGFLCFALLRNAHPW